MRLVLDADKTMTRAPKAIDAVRAELARRQVLDVDLVGAMRRRPETRLTRLTRLFGWGELSGEDYRRQMSANETATLPPQDPSTTANGPA